jgi:SAM-dependent methyltransferase
MPSAMRARARAGEQTPGAAYERAQVAAGRLPQRYGEPWFDLFAERVDAALRPGMAILDVGSGRDPVLDPAERPAGCEYAGLDVSRSELAAAPAGAYDEAICADIAQPQAALLGRFDLIVSWQVLEHVRPLAASLELMRSYLGPGGRLVAQLSGGLSVFALAGRCMPHALTRVLMVELLGAQEHQTFPTHYDRCRYSALTAMLGEWSEHEIVPRYRGAGYLRFARSLERAYLRYENWIVRRGIAELATHYLIEAVR